MIPKIIHQIWIGPRPAPRRWMDGWRDLNPTWKYEFWDEDRCAAFGFANAAQIKRSPEWCGKADIMRYEILRRHGGVYIDADAEALRPLEDELTRHDSWACYESEVGRPGLIANGYLGASPGNRLMNRLVERCAVAPVATQRAWMATGPLMLTETVRQQRYDDLHVYPSGTFIPEHYSGAAQPRDVEPYARQHWGSTLGDVYEPEVTETPAPPAIVFPSQLNSAAFGDGWGTHLPLLAAAVASADPGDVLELGSGSFSTPVLSAMCAATKRRVVTIDNNLEWLRRFASLRSAHHDLVGALPDWTAVEDIIHGRRRWAVVLVDHAPVERRVVDLVALADRAEFVVVHDANYPHVYGYEAAFAKYRYRHDYTLLEPHTTVLSNVRRFPGT